MVSRDSAAPEEERCSLAGKVFFSGVFDHDRLRKDCGVCAIWRESVPQGCEGAPRGKLSMCEIHKQDQSNEQVGAFV